MKVRRKILHRIPFFHQTYRSLRSIEPGKLGIVDDDVRGLQAGILGLSVDDEFAAEHPKIRIRLFAVRDVAIRKILRVG